MFFSKTCGLDGCQEFHHRLLHQHTIKKTSGASSREGVLLHNKDTDSKAQQQSVKSEQNTLVVSKAVVPDNRGETTDKNGKVTLMSETPMKGNIALRTVSVYLRNGDRKLRINALLDDASTRTYINADVAAELVLQGHPQKVNISVLNGQVETFDRWKLFCDKELCAPAGMYFHNPALFPLMHYLSHRTGIGIKLRGNSTNMLVTSHIRCQ